MKKYFVIGNPINHSLSPKLHNYWLKEKNIDAIYDKKKIQEKNLQTIISEVKEKKINALLDTSHVSDIIKVISADTFLHPIYAGNAFATVKSNDKKKCITIRPTSF